MGLFSFLFSMVNGLTIRGASLNRLKRMTLEMRPLE